MLHNKCVPRVMLLLACVLAARAETLEDAVLALAKKAGPHLAANESARVVAHNLSPLANAEVVRAQALLDRALRRRVRNMSVREVTLTISQNVRGYLLVAEIRRGEDRDVEMESFDAEPQPAPAALLPMTKRLVWEQASRILDVAFADSAMLVLDASGVTRYERPNGRWERAESAALTAPAVRDLRGRLETAGDSLGVYLPGMTCRGTSKPLKLACEQASAPFTLAGAAVKFTPGRNTLEGSADVLPVCGSRTLATGEGDTAALYEGETAVSESVDFPGPITELWPTLAVARDAATGNYAAYALTFDCGR